ncbi:hypothetical protein PQO03_12090 [Lentisphaera profundi]|uniref:N-sulphoglucosamine sulphohydrolase C-terminal domain-containing protein n=1 Tax=Lentisphaera profundi TaxID=1658616 RepID=A0ABY7VZ77_9BACT|nr:hypothetical protein [Lentisphaera profundi]WDE98579.1 hypothetical protein PQO03_12090 [Lentisphaera profundi]
MGTEDERKKPIGFWHNFQSGQGTWSDKILKAIMKKQKANSPLPHDALRINKDVYDFPQFPEDSVTGHAAWNDWPWKLHRINGTKFELYNLQDDPMETRDLSRNDQHKQRLASMKKELDLWMRSVIRSLNGQDYATPIK